MIPTVADIINVINRHAPQWMAEEWDNVGLQTGDPQWPVRRIWIALDPSLEVVMESCRKDIDLLITHHPLIFRPLKSIDFNTPIGSIIKMASEHQLAIFSAHTNLDIAREGVNDILARRIGLTNVEVLQKTKSMENYRLVVYCLADAKHRILESLLQAKTNPIDTHPDGLYRNFVTDVFGMKSIDRSDSDINMKTDTLGASRIEIVIDNTDIDTLIEHLKHYHADETIAYDVFPLVSCEKRHGIGRIGTLEIPTDLKSLALTIKKKLKLDFVRFAGNPDLPIIRVAICSGSGSSLMRRFLSSGTQAYISGDLHYHDAREAEAAKCGIIDVGHFPSEHLMVKVMADQLQNEFSAKGIDLRIEACTIEKDPFIVL